MKCEARGMRNRGMRIRRNVKYICSLRNINSIYCCTKLPACAIGSFSIVIWMRTGATSLSWTAYELMELVRNVRYSY